MTRARTGGRTSRTWAEVVAAGRASGRPAIVRRTEGGETTRTRTRTAAEIETGRAIYDMFRGTDIGIDHHRPTAGGGDDASSGEWSVDSAATTAPMTEAGGDDVIDRGLISIATWNISD